MVLVQELLSNKRWPMATPLSEKGGHPQVVDFPRSPTKAMDVELAFLDLPGKLDTGNDDGGVVESFKTQHRPRAALNATVVLFDSVLSHI